MALGVVEWVKEATAGLLVATTTQVLDDDYTFEWGDEPVISQPSFSDGTYAEHSNGDVLGTVCKAQISAALDFEQSPWFLSTGIKVVAGVGDGGAPIAYTYTFAPTLTAKDTINTGSYKFKADSLIETMEYGFLESFEISVDGPQQRTNFNMALVGRQVATATLSNPAHVTPELVNGNKWKAYMDDTGGTIGTTQYAGCLKGWRFRSGNLWTPYNCVKDQNFFEGIERPKLRPELMLRVAVDSSMAGILTDMRAGTRQLLKLTATGSQIHGGTVTNKSFSIEMPGRIMAPSKVGSTQNQSQFTREFTFSGERDVAYGNLFKCIVVNGEAALRV